MERLYCSSFINYSRRKSRKVLIGGVPMGSEFPVRIQSMTNTYTADVESTVRQIMEIYEAGADYVRITIPSVSDAGKLKEIVTKLRYKNCQVPVIADIHFNPKLALLAAEVVEKVRINPGNFADNRSAGYNSEENKEQLDLIKYKMSELVKVCRLHGTALRIGVNHGSLSGRIMDRYGDTPEGMAESAMEYLRICSELEFLNVVVSIKASNTRIMVYANRLLASMMKAENMDFPIHLGVTEAGEGEDGRIKSATGIGAMLADGIGDTIRVSLTEDPAAEIPVARKLVDIISERNDHAEIDNFGNYPIDPFSFTRRKTHTVSGTGGRNHPIVVFRISGGASMKNLEEAGWRYKKPGWKFDELSADVLIADRWDEELPLPQSKIFISPENEKFPLLSWEAYYGKPGKGPKLVEISTSDLTRENIEFLNHDKEAIILLSTTNKNVYGDLRAAMFRLINAGNQSPVIFHLTFSDDDKEVFQLRAATETGGLFIDGLGDGIWLENPGNIAASDILSAAFGILQACRVRMSRTDYISCPSCGRTLFDIQTTTRKIREHTSHLKNLRIGIMGCIVNGPGEMADADYGYVGSGKGKISLYKGKELIRKNVPEDNAVEELINLIREYGDWKDPGD